MAIFENNLTRKLGIDTPIICGAMYPSSNPELVAAASEAGGIGIVQPLTLEFVHKLPFRDGLRHIRTLTDRPIGMNVLTEKSSKMYLERMQKWVDIALEEGVRFFVSSLGNPQWIVDKVNPYGGFVYHDVTERKWAKKAIDGGVHGLIAVNERAGGHAGPNSMARLMDELGDLGLPIIAAGGIGCEENFVEALRLGYEGVQMGTRFIATEESAAHQEYKNAILDAEEGDIVLTEKITGVPVAVIRTEAVERYGTKAGPVARFMLRRRKLKHYMRMYYSAMSFWRLRRSAHAPMSSKDYWQAGKSVSCIRQIVSTDEIIENFTRAAIREFGTGTLPETTASATL